MTVRTGYRGSEAVQGRRGVLDVFFPAERARGRDTLVRGSAPKIHRRWRDRPEAGPSTRHEVSRRRGRRCAQCRPNAAVTCRAEGRRVKRSARPHEIFASKQQEIVKTDSLSVMVVK